MTTAVRVLSGFFKLTGGLLALVLLVYVAVNLASMARGWQQRGELADEFAARAKPLLPALRDRRDAWSDEVGRGPDRAWIEQACSFDHDDSGWMINNYRERCTLRAVSAWRVESAEAGHRLLQVAPPDHTVDDPTCEELGTLSDRTRGAAATDAGRVVVFLARPGRAPEDGCGSRGAYGSEARALEGEGQVEPLPLDSTWVVVVDDAGDLLDEDIGCARWSVLFCDNPFIDHAWADLG